MVAYPESVDELADSLREFDPLTLSELLVDPRVLRAVGVGNVCPECLPRTCCSFKIIGRPMYATHKYNSTV